MSASRAPLQRHLRRVALAAVAVGLALGIAACGGSSSSGASAAQLLSQTFSTNFSEIHSGDISLALSADLKGLRGLAGKPISLQLSGPFSESSAGEAFDFDATATVSGQTLPLAVLSTGTALYLEIAGTYYAMPAGVNSALAKAVHSSGSSSSNLLSRLGINPLSWLTDPRIVGSTNVNGVSTEHLTAQVDVEQLLGDVGKLASHTSGVSGQVSKELSPANLDQLASAVNSARVDIYSGAADHILREFSAAVAFTVPPADQRSVDGLTGGSVTLDLTISNLNASETITPPSSSEPFSDLLGGRGLSSL